MDKKNQEVVGNSTSLEDGAKSWLSLTATFSWTHCFGIGALVSVLIGSQLDRHFGNSETTALFVVGVAALNCFLMWATWFPIFNSVNNSAQVRNEGIEPYSAYSINHKLILWLPCAARSFYVGP